MKTSNVERRLASETKSANEERQLMIDFISSTVCPDNFKFVQGVVKHAMWAILQDPTEAHELIDPTGLNEFELLEAAKNFMVADRRDFIKHNLSVTEDFVAFKDYDLQTRITH
jgi:hypothetical protein